MIKLSRWSSLIIPQVSSLREFFLRDLRILSALPIGEKFIIQRHAFRLSAVPGTGRPRICTTAEISRNQVAGYCLR